MTLKLFLKKLLRRVVFLNHILEFSIKLKLSI